MGGERFAFINVWRNVRQDTPVRTLPLALCEASSVSPSELVVFEIHYADRIGENYFAKHSVHHRWCYFPDATRDEALLIKQWDSAGVLARSRGHCADGEDLAHAATAPSSSTMSLHSAFRDPTSTDKDPDRMSIEVRVVAVFGNSNDGDGDCDSHSNSKL